MAVLRDIVERQLTRADLLAVIAAIGDFSAHHRPAPGDLLRWERPVLVLHAEHDRAFARQVKGIRAVYPTAAFQVLAGAGHGALFTHTDSYIGGVLGFLADPPAFASTTSGLGQ